ncbi:ATP-binding cassette domain-containing protein [Azorhizophilus paspali]|uniref:ATP-binding cassette domain-containing protein n=1 Tax=Azorhizophilus paspali TaxID=69963 RepID=UPI003624B29A
MGFAAIALLAMLSRMLSSVLFECLGQYAHAELRRFVSARVMATDFRRLEEIGGPRVLSALSEHCARVADFFVGFPAILVNGIVVVGCLVYMAWLSWSVFFIAAVVIGLGSLGYHLAHLWAIRHLDAASREQDRLFGHFRALVDGAKELRLHASKRERFARDVLGASIEEVRRERTRGSSIFLALSAWGNFLIYAFIGLVLFVLVGEVPERERIMTGFALVFVFMVSPLENLLLVLPRANLAKVSAQRIDEITQELQPSGDEATTRLPAAFASLSLEGASHRYYHEVADEMFTLGPVDLDFSPGQISFLVGGNGSGKTTLAKLLVGLYRPEEGRSESTARRWRRRASTVTASSFRLSSRTFTCSTACWMCPRPTWMPGATSCSPSSICSTRCRYATALSPRALSQGQRKRLALVVAYLEDRPFLVFDEWAADQDPLFKEVFYCELLPELKAMGKAVLVISHDDRYFHLADRVIRMENGQVVAIEKPDRHALAEPRSLESSLPS